ncbi:MAG: hypothetical protein WA210_16585, partial [Burkholderiaceae bacterium]
PKPTHITAYCSKMPQPEVPGVDFTGRISLTARATIKGGKVIEADIVPNSISGTRDRKIQRAFAGAVTAAMLQYTCVGDNVVVEQQFAFTIN